MSRRSVTKEGCGCGRELGGWVWLILQPLALTPTPDIFTFGVIQVIREI
jgi:hypothetical protein